MDTGAAFFETHEAHVLLYDLEIPAALCQESKACVLLCALGAPPAGDGHDTGSLGSQLAQNAIAHASSARPQLHS